MSSRAARIKSMSETMPHFAVPAPALAAARDHRNGRARTAIVLATVAQGASGGAGEDLRPHRVRDGRMLQRRRHVAALDSVPSNS